MTHLLETALKGFEMKVFQNLLQMPGRVYMTEGNAPPSFTHSSDPPLTMQRSAAATSSTAPWSRRKSAKRGMAILEMALIGPWFFFMFVGALDWGLLANALISMESGARTAAVYTSSSSSTAADSAMACSLVLGEMRKLPNIGDSATACSGSPLAVVAVSVTGPDSAPASQVTVTYSPVAMIPIPGLLPSRFTLTRTVKMRLRS